MESFEHLCKVALEAERFVVTSNVKFPVRRTFKNGPQTHGYEVDLVGARGDRLVLAEVKSFFGSRGVNRQSFAAIAHEGPRTDFGLFKLLNNESLRQAVVAAARTQYGYELDQVEMRVYVGRFAGGSHEADVRAHLATFGAPEVKVVGLTEVVTTLIGLAEQRTYRNDPVVMTIKALMEEGRLRLGLPETARGQRLASGPSCNNGRKVG